MLPCSLLVVIGPRFQGPVSLLCLLAGLLSDGWAGAGRPA